MPDKCRLGFLPQQYARRQPSPLIPLPPEREVRTLSNGRGQGEGYLKKTQKYHKLYLSQTTVKAFTLAEVLITLVVIGIIAAITVPMIHANYKKRATITQLKKGYSTLTQIIRRSELDNGTIDTWKKPVAGATVSYDDYINFLNLYIYPYVNSDNDKRQHLSYDVNNIDGEFVSGCYKWVKLFDGSSFELSMLSNPNYMWIFYDVNGERNPNRLGKDIFMFRLSIGSPAKISFWLKGYKDYHQNVHRDITDYICKKGTGESYAGGSCGAWIEQNGWEFPDDYPW